MPNDTEIKSKAHGGAAIGQIKHFKSTSQTIKPKTRIQTETGFNAKLKKKQNLKKK